mmetsp:Transcript_10980/g.15923  ORF Transcript_10980/g.15923 Transcript_10980/m.15923 type:complete len:85 (-) Transcript_10980:108-362(-)
MRIWFEFHFFLYYDGKEYFHLKMAIECDRRTKNPVTPGMVTSCEISLFRSTIFGTTLELVMIMTTTWPHVDFAFGGEIQRHSDG